MKNIVRAWMGLFLIAIFTISMLPLALAQENTTTTETGDVDTTEPETTNTEESDETDTTDDTDSTDESDTTDETDSTDNSDEADSDNTTDEAETTDSETETDEERKKRRAELREKFNERKDKLKERRDTLRDTYKEKRDDLKEKRDQLKERVKEVREKHEFDKDADWLTKAANIDARVDKLLERLDEKHDELEEKYENLKTSGIDIPLLSVRKALFKDAIDDALESLNEARRLYSAAEEIMENNPDDNRKKEAREMYHYAKQSYKEAVHNVKQAINIYKRVVNDIRKAGGLNWDENAPNFTPGEDLGFFLWRDGGRNYVCVSGDGEAHEYKGRIVAENMKHVYTYHFDSRDEYRVVGNELEFSGHVNPHKDCIGFRSKGIVQIELTMDGSDNPQVIYLGEEMENPESASFELPLSSVSPVSPNTDETTPNDVEA